MQVYELVLKVPIRATSQDKAEEISRLLQRVIRNSVAQLEQDAAKGRKTRQKIKRSPRE